jgi:hypothetical protein
MRKYLALIAVLALCGCGSSGDSAEQMISFTPEHFRDTAQIVDDHLETTAIISTEQGRHEIGDMVTDGWKCKSFLRAFVNKRSGAATYQLYVVIRYFGDRRGFSTINYFTPKGVQSSSLVKIARDKGSCPKSDECVHKEIVGFDMSESMVRQIAATYAPNARNGWLFKLKGRIIGADQEDVIMPSEAAGLLLAVQAYKVSLHH